MWEYFAAAALPAVASWLGSEQQNRRAVGQADSANAFSAEQFATRYQTTTRDMMAAGLNPMLAYQQGGGSAPTGQQAPVPANSGSAAAGSYMQARMNDGQLKLLDAQADATSAQAAKTKAETPYVDTLSQADVDLKHSSAGQARQNVLFMQTQAAKISEEIKNVPKEGDRLTALARSLTESAELMAKQGMTQEEIAKQTRWLAVKAMHDSDLAGLDVQAARMMGNVGREAGQLEPIIKIIMQLLRTR